jgi:alpha-tubulin suppressor-like RCC1 family protein
MGGGTGDGTSTYRSNPVQEYSQSINWVSAFSNTQTSGGFGIKSDGSLWGWTTDNTWGQLGYNDTIGCTYPQKVPGTQNWKSVSSGSNGAVCGLTKDGQLWTWGYNNGAAGWAADSTTAHRSRPVQVLPGRFWLQASQNSAIY